jgi:hypothetical protein
MRPTPPQRAGNDSEPSPLGRINRPTRDASHGRGGRSELQAAGGRHRRVSLSLLPPCERRPCRATTRAGSALCILGKSGEQSRSTCSFIEARSVLPLVLVPYKGLAPTRLALWFAPRYLPAPQLSSGYSKRCVCTSGSVAGCGINTKSCALELFDEMPRLE